MKIRTTLGAIMIFSLMCFLGSSVIGCGQMPKAAEAPVTAPAEIPVTAPEETPAAAPAEKPVTTPSDTSTMSEEEVCAYIWSQLPTKLPGDYDIAQFSKDSRKAEYEGGGKWSFSVSGSESNIEKLPPEIVEKVEDYWVERQTRKVTTCDLNLKAVFYERTNLVEIVEVLRSNVTTRTEQDETPVRKEFTVNWMHVVDWGHSFEFESSIRNTGRVPLKNLSVRFFLVDEELNVLATEQVDFKPDVIAVYENAKAYSRVEVKGMPEKGRYQYQFLTASGDPFNRIPPPQGEKAKFYHIGEEKVTRSAVRLEPTESEDIENFNARVEPTNEQVRDTALLALENPPEGIASDSEAWKIWQLNNWVASNINYVSDPKGKEYFAYAHETLETKAGDCDDVAVLLASLYEAVGLDAVIASVDTDNITGYDHAACMVYWPEDADKFCAEEREIMSGLGLTSPSEAFYTLNFGSEISEFLTEQNVAYASYDGIWIVADPIFAKFKNITGFVTHRPYTIRSVFNVGN